ncbi:DUF3375 family protein [Streptomyces sp. PT12]|uniref:DUF3375 family protein n=1 Tax=Streptomyces sp. PT12 TaxID=1510197 RepID=UPI002852C120|nr:DUF3375 family protein [Streptomyces sp. PT12]
MREIPAAFDRVSGLVRHPTWMLLRADHAALVLSFCGTVFVDENARGVPETMLESRLDDRLYLLNERESGSFPRPAAAYLAEWTKNGWLRKYYPPVPSAITPPHPDLRWRGGRTAQPAVRAPGPEHLASPRTPPIPR